MRLSLIVYSSLLVFLAAGCAQYTYGDATYATRDEAVQAARDDIDRSVSGVTPVTQRLGGRALAVVPTRPVIQAHGVKGGPAAGGDAVDYIVDTLEINILGVTEGVRKGQIFDQVTVLRHDNPESALADTYDYKLWLFTGSGGRWQWYLSRKGVAEREPLSGDAGVAKDERFNAFNKSVIRAGERLGAKPTPLAASTQ